MSSTDEREPRVDDNRANSEGETRDLTPEKVTLETIQESIVALHAKLDQQKQAQERCGESVVGNTARIEALDTDCKRLSAENQDLNC